MTAGSEGAGAGSGAMMSRPPVESRGVNWGKTLLWLALLALVGYFVWRTRTIITTVIVALIIAAAAQAMVEPLCRRRVRFLRPHTQRLLATILVFVGMFAVVFWSVKTLVSPFETEFRKLSENLPTYQASLEAQWASVQKWYDNLPPGVKNWLDQQKGNVAVPSPAAWFGDVIKRSASMISHIVELILVPVLAFYFTLDGKTLRNQFLSLLPRRRHRQAIAIMSEGGAIMRAYIISQFWLAVIAGVVVGVGLKAIGMDYALILGLFAGITRAIPVIGPLLGGIPLVLLSFVYGAQIGNPYLWVWTLVFFTILHFVESKFIMPKFVGHALNLHAVVVIVALLVGGEFFGLMGMFLAAPIAALIRVLLMHYVIVPRRRNLRRRNDGPTPRPGRTRVLSLERAVRHRAAAAAAAAATAATGTPPAKAMPPQTPTPTTADAATSAPDARPAVSPYEIPDEQE